MWPPLESVSTPVTRKESRKRFSLAASKWLLTFRCSTKPPASASSEPQPPLACSRADNASRSPSTARSTSIASSWLPVMDTQVYAGEPWPSRTAAPSRWSLMTAVVFPLDAVADLYTRTFDSALFRKAAHTGRQCFSSSCCCSHGTRSCRKPELSSESESFCTEATSSRATSLCLRAVCITPSSTPCTCADSCSTLSMQNSRSRARSGSISRKCCAAAHLRRKSPAACSVLSGEQQKISMGVGRRCFWLMKSAITSSLCWCAHWTGRRKTFTFVIGFSLSGNSLLKLSISGASARMLHGGGTRYSMAPSSIWCTCANISCGLPPSPLSPPSPPGPSPRCSIPSASRRAWLRGRAGHAVRSRWAAASVHSGLPTNPRDSTSCLREKHVSRGRCTSA
mmetsp:Transcript_34338/g.75695  ORF Transcript_34338/g.75695 Transcript_34338/m.75695 type:complete len:395 (-) Transcript_34338:506-1690(-)